MAPLHNVKCCLILINYIYFLIEKGIKYFFLILSEKKKKIQLFSFQPYLPHFQFLSKNLRIYTGNIVID